jgi:hypothetical protein
MDKDVHMTIILPQPLIPAGMTIMEALSRGYLPPQVKVLNAGLGLPCQTLHSLLAAGVLSHSTRCDTLTFEMIGSPAIHVFFCTYGGN